MPSLRLTLAGSTALVGAIALLVAGALVVLTTVLHQTTSSAVTSVENVRLAEEAEIDLLLHERTTDRLVQRDYEVDLQQRLTEARRFVTTESEARVLAEAVSEVDAYLSASQDPDLGEAELAASQEDAYGALEALVKVNVDQARAAEAEAEWWDRLADSVGTAAGMLLVVVGGTLAWLRWRAFAPIFSLADAMERFGKGDRDVRAKEEGPAELKEMGRRFNEMASILESQRRSQMAFLGGVAHDLKNPLSVLKMAVRAIRPDRPLPDEVTLRQLIDRVDRQIYHLERMVGDFLDMAKIESGTLELKLEPQDARILVRDVVDLFEGAPTDHRLVLSVPDERVALACDHVRIEQVVTNLISNAIKYSPPGTSVRVAVEQRGSEAVVLVSDQGVGLSEQDRTRVFEPFRRVGLSKEAIPGVGLGLYVVRRIVEAHGGRIEVDSTPGAGSTFRVRLPGGPAPTAPEGHSSSIVE